MALRPVVVVDYDDDWPLQFEERRAAVWPAVADIALRIEHVGSTSIPGLAAKPIIDMTIVVAHRDDLAPTIERLATIGYRHRGDLGIEGREAFDHPPEFQKHNLYVCAEGTIGVVNQVAVRDYLRAHPDVARSYGKLKKSLAAEFPHDIESYVFGKTDFVLDVLRRAGLTEEQLASIERVNRPLKP
ncbi:MAG TPA: GrpB family protein [Vicinamibacterales bacterium]|nr:GrpB family protein [Vicinamibacterales bacterium]